jgi:hypothetical protein
VLRTNQKLAALVAQAAGAVNAVARAVIVYMICVVGGAALSIRWGIPGVATSTSLAILIVSIESCYIAMRVSGLTLRSMLGAYVPGLMLAALVTVTAWPLAGALRAAHLPNALVFAVVAVSAIALCLVMLVLWLRGGRGDFAWLGEELRRFRRKKRRT